MIRFIFVTASGRETEANPLLKSLIELGVKDMLLSYFFLSERRPEAIKMYSSLKVKS